MLMVSKLKPKKLTKKQQRAITLLAVIGVIVAAAFVVFGMLSPEYQGKVNNANVPNEGSIVIKGEMLCLPHKDTSGPQTMECAFGLKDEKGKYYAIQDTDPNYRNTASVVMNVNVEVTGTFEKGTSDIYPTVGTIKATKITEVQE